MFLRREPLQDQLHVIVPALPHGFPYDAAVFHAAEQRFIFIRVAPVPGKLDLQAVPYDPAAAVLDAGLVVVALQGADLMPLGEAEPFPLPEEGRFRRLPGVVRDGLHCPAVQVLFVPVLQGLRPLLELVEGKAILQALFLQEEAQARRALLVLTGDRGSFFKERAVLLVLPELLDLDTDMLYKLYLDPDRVEKAQAEHFLVIFGCEELLFEYEAGGPALIHKSYALLVLNVGLYCLK